MSFMERQVEFGLWYEVEHDHTDFISYYVVGELPLPEGLSLNVEDELEEDGVFEWLWAKLEEGEKSSQKMSDVRSQAAEIWAEVQAAFSDYVETTRPEKIVGVRLTEGWGARLSAPGYMDCTEWSVFETEEEAEAYLEEMYGDDEE